METKGIPITDPVELAWCAFAREHEKMGLPIFQSASIVSYKAGAEWASARIREELLALVCDRRSEIYGLGNGFTVELEADLLIAALDRIIPEEP